MMRDKSAGAPSEPRRAGDPTSNPPKPDAEKPQQMKKDPPMSNSEKPNEASEKGAAENEKSAEELTVEELENVAGGATIPGARKWGDIVLKRGINP